MQADSERTAQERAFKLEVPISRPETQVPLRRALPGNSAGIWRKRSSTCSVAVSTLLKVTCNIAVKLLFLF